MREYLITVIDLATITYLRKKLNVYPFNKEYYAATNTGYWGYNCSLCHPGSCGG